VTGLQMRGQDLITQNKNIALAAKAAKAFPIVLSGNTARANGNPSPHRMEQMLDKDLKKIQR